MNNLMQYLDMAPINARNLSDVDFEYLIAYHITGADNIESIKENGITARSSSQSYDRPAAVYLFVGKYDITPTNIDLLGLSGGYKVIRVRIPAQEVLDKMHWDGLYNVTFNKSSTAVQFFGDIPQEWITSYDYKI